MKRLKFVLNRMKIILALLVLAIVGLVLSQDNGKSKTAKTNSGVASGNNQEKRSKIRQKVQDWMKKRKGVGRGERCNMSEDEKSERILFCLTVSLKNS